MSKRETQSSKLRAELERRAGHDPVLERLLHRRARPTADDYISMQWLGDGLPEEIDSEEREIIDLLKALEAEKS